MEFKEHPEEGKYELGFFNEEVDVVRAAFREHIRDKVRQGDAGYLDNLHFSSAEAEGPKFSLKTGNYTIVSRIIEQFGDNTDEAIDRIGQEATSPAFEDDSILRRRKLGKQAATLYEEFMAKATENFEEHLDTPGFTDEDIQRFLINRSPEADDN